MNFTSPFSNDEMTCKKKGKLNSTALQGFGESVDNAEIGQALRIISMLLSVQASIQANSGQNPQA
jgi:hypothetical protein